MNLNNMMNKLINVISFYIIYKQNSQIKFKLQTEINEHDSMIKQLQQINMNNFTN